MRRAVLFAILTGLVAIEGMTSSCDRQVASASAAIPEPLQSRYEIRTTGLEVNPTTVTKPCQNLPI
jgi:hypothetical protein